MTTTIPPNLDHVDANLKLLSRELWVVTTTDGPRRAGLLASWVASASIDRERPVLLAGLAPNHFTTELVLASNAFAAHLLRPDQVDLAWNFARDSSRSLDKFAGLEVSTHETKSPLLNDCLAWFDCRVFHRHVTGDRLYFWAEVVGTLRVPSPPGTGQIAPPLREHDFFRALTAERRQKLAADRDADASALRPLHDRWRAENRD